VNREKAREKVTRKGDRRDDHEQVLPTAHTFRQISSFEQLPTLAASGAYAGQAPKAAVAFRQDDNITVITLTRLANA
jgi:hypothetical protein